MKQELEPSDEWMEIKSLKQQLTPKIYERSHQNDDDKICDKGQQAELTVSQLEKTMGDYLHEGDEFHLDYVINGESQRFYPHDIDIENRFNIGDITVEEIKSAIKTMANNKTGGIDNWSAEFLKCLDDNNLKEIADILKNY